MSGDPFDVVVTRWVDKAKQKALQAFQATCHNAIARVKELTPVKTGYLRANWTAVGPDGVLPVAGEQQDSDSIINNLRLGDRLIIVNPVVYAARVNFGFIGTDSLGRHYHQKGKHMVEQTISEMPAIAAAAVQQVSEQP